MQLKLSRSPCHNKIKPYTDEIVSKKPIQQYSSFFQGLVKIWDWLYN